VKIGQGRSESQNRRERFCTHNVRPKASAMEGASQSTTDTLNFSALLYPALTRDEWVKCLLDMHVDDKRISFSVPGNPAAARGTFAGVSPASLCTVLQSSPWTPPDRSIKTIS